jgi:hypothetical protein
VDLTNAIDSLEDVARTDGRTPATGNEPSRGDLQTPAPREQGDKPKKHQEKDRGRRVRSADSGDVFDPNQYGFSALVNKLDEVTDDEATDQTDANRR